MSDSVEMTDAGDVTFSMANPHASDRSLMKQQSGGGSTRAVKPVPSKFKLSDEERDEYSNVFDLFCGEDSKNISRKEVGRVMRKLGQNPSDAELSEMIDEVDIDGYGAINKKNFMILMTKKVKGSGADSNNEVDVNADAFKT